MTELPNRSNFYSTLRTDLLPKQIAQLYSDIGWRVRKCGWTDYELCSPVAALVIENDSPLLMHGSVADLPLNVEGLLAPLRRAGITFTAECYGTDKQLLQTIEG